MALTFDECEELFGALRALRNTIPDNDGYTVEAYDAFREKLVTITNRDTARSAERARIKRSLLKLIEEL